MWIRSQNQTSLEFIRSISIRVTLGGEEDSREVEGWAILTMRPNTYTELGIYETRERAIEVMDEIESEMIQIEMNKLDSKYSIPSIVYQMPKN